MTAIAFFLLLVLVDVSLTVLNDENITKLHSLNEINLGLDSMRVYTDCRITAQFFSLSYCLGLLSFVYICN